jgi:hypothetical protein
MPITNSNANPFNNVQAGHIGADASQEPSPQNPSAAQAVRAQFLKSSFPNIKK